MPARDDFGSGAGRPGGFGGGAGGFGNGGVGGGMGGGYRGGGAGRMGGINSSTGLTTGNRMIGGMAFGRPGGPAMNPGAFGYRPQAGIAQGPLSGARPRPAAVAGVNPVPENVPPLEDVLMPAVPNVFNQNYLGSLANFRNMMNNRYGWGAAQPGPGPMPSAPQPNPLANDASSQVAHRCKSAACRAAWECPVTSTPAFPAMAVAATTPETVAPVRAAGKEQSHG